MIAKDTKIQNKISFPINKAKVTLLCLLSLGFVVIGFYMFNAKPSWKYPEWSLKTFGAVGIVFFGFCALAFMAIMFRKNTGLLISEDGFWDRLSVFGLELIAWDDVRCFKIEKFNAQTLLAVYLKEGKEQQYIQSIKNPIKKAMLNYVISIFGYKMSLTLLKAKSDEIYKALNTELKNARKRTRIKT